jgi:hypothetical protein
MHSTGSQEKQPWQVVVVLVTRPWVHALQVLMDWSCRRGLAFAEQCQRYQSLDLVEE